jgi:transcriptional regulator with XRE-family HTH domain
MANAQSARRELLGLTLRRYREAAGFTGREAAAIIDCDTSKISRIESGTRGIKAFELAGLLTGYGVSGPVREVLTLLGRPERDYSWRTDFSYLLPASWLDLAEAESAATGICAYAPIQVPALLQTEAYAKAAIEADGCILETARDAALTLVLARQEQVLGERMTPFTVVIGEAALQQWARFPQMMRGQVGYLAAVAEGCTHVTIRVLPLAAGPHASGGAGGFALLEYGPIPNIGVAHVDTPAGGVTLVDSAIIPAYREVLADLQAEALDGQQTIRFLRDLAGPSAGGSNTRAPGTATALTPGTAALSPGRAARRAARTAFCVSTREVRRAQS